MEQLLEFCHRVFDQSPIAFSIARVHLDDDGAPLDISYEYLNPAMAAYTNQEPKDLEGKRIYEIWPNSDYTWLNNFYRACYEDTPVEFEAVSVALEEFEHATVFPVAEGCCGFILQDVSTWVGQVRSSLENAEAGLFFYDMATRAVQLPATTMERYGLRKYYLSISDFCEENFGPACLDEVRRQMASFRSHDGSLFYEGRLADGRWLRISLAHAGRTDMFAFGFLEDVTRAKQLEEANARHLNIIDSLSRENYALYLANLALNTMEPYRIRESDPDTARYVLADAHQYHEGISDYIERFVHEADRQQVGDILLMPALREHLREQGGEVTVTYRRVMGDDADYMQMRVLSLSEDHDEVVLAARDISDETRAQMRQKALLQDALALAQHASNAKSTFLANMSHDIRTPMNAITGFTSIALSHPDDPARVQDCLEKILLSSNHLLSLINDILDMSRIESGKVQITEEPLSLRAMAGDLRGLFQEQADERGIHLAIDFSGIRDDAIYGDPLRLQQILVNLIGNALKFTDAGGSVVVRGRQRGDAPTGYGTYDLSVKDTGRGMAPEFLAHIFEPFEREAADGLPKVEGTGLGMPITKNLVDMMGGAIAIDSTPGVGSEFVVTLDLRLQDDAADRPRTGAADQPATPRHDPSRFRGKRVMVADDDDLSREIMQEILREQGLVVDAAEDGATAVEMLAASDPFAYDAVLMDLHMPHLDGIAAARAMRALERDDAASLPIIAVTADAFEEDRRTALEAGMTAHVAKPIDLARLLALLDELL
ncbi:MAG: response regulator [Eggerthellaceae bacterium]|nr:response regulator [Eggerthellaceae bacterium]